MHNSTLVYESIETRKSQEQINRKRVKAKTNGSYFEAPLVEKTLSTKPLSFRNVFRSIV
jgi:hypothetical protein